MPRYIDADALKAKYEQMLPEIGDGYHKETLQDVLFELEYAPTISPNEVRGVGKWVDKGVRAWSCSCCGTPLNHIRQFASFEKNELPNYCPNCGARMTEVSEDA